MKEGKHEVVSVHVYDLHIGPRGGVLFLPLGNTMLLFKKRSRDPEPTEADLLHYCGKTSRSSGSEEGWTDWE